MRPGEGKGTLPVKMNHMADVEIGGRRAQGFDFYESQHKWKQETTRKKLVVSMRDVYPLPWDGLYDFSPNIYPIYT